MKNLLLGIVMLLGVAAAAPAKADYAAPATVGYSGYGTYVWNNYYYCPYGSAPVYLNPGYNLVTTYRYPYGYVQSWVYAPYFGVYCVY